MFINIVVFEVKNRLKRISTWVYFGLFFSLAYLSILAAGGVFPNVRFGMSGGGGLVMLNSPQVLFVLTSLLSYLGLIITSAIMGNAGYRDFHHETHELFFTCPVRPITYLTGRYVGAALVLLGIMTSLFFGTVLATFMPFLDSGKLGPFRLMSHLYPLLLIVFPNVLIFGAIFFAVAALTRKSLPTYVAGVVLFIGYMLALQFISDIEHQSLGGILDPFGLQASFLLTRYWTAVEKNTLLIPLRGLLLANRALWACVGGGFFLMTILKFRYTARQIRRFAGKAVPHSDSALLQKTSLSRSLLTSITPQFSLSHNVKTVWRLLWLEFQGIISSVYFLVIALAGVLYIGVSAGQLDIIYGTATYPVTYKVLELTSGTFALFMVILITVYAGELVWKERSLKMDQLVDVLPIPAWVPYFSKFGALIVMEALLLGIVMLCGLGIQVANGYTNFELGLYLKELFVLNLTDYILLTVPVLLLHTLLPHKYFGHLAMILFFVVSLFRSKLGLEHNMLYYLSDPGTIYSDMNGYAHLLFGVGMFRLYWAAFATGLGILTYVFWRRGTDSNRRLRLHEARRRFTAPWKTAAIAALIVFVGSGAFVYYNTNILNTFETNRQQEARVADYEKQYKQYESLPQPKITDIEINVDIYPYTRKLYVQGTYTLKNTTNVPIENVHLHVHPAFTVEWMALGNEQEKMLNDTRLGYSIYELPQPMQPGDTLPFTFKIAYAPKGFKNSMEDEGEILLIHNGTFLNSEIFPHIGYNASAELSEDDVRKTHGLSPKDPMPPLESEQGRARSLLSNDADWLTYDIVVSTAADQLALAPGRLMKSWTDGDRAYFHYSTEDTPVQHFYAILSGRYAVKTDRWQDVPIEVYHHPAHDYNIDRMIAGVKQSLDYYTEAFGPYPFPAVRIVEFPRYQTFAQAFPGMIPYSESIGFIAKVDEEDDKDINYPFYVTAHEMGHQWWGHQVTAANVQGNSFVMESLTQYSALMVMKREFGDSQMKRFLKYELDQYLNGRSFEKHKEQPLYKVEQQGYIYYNKGSVAMYALQDYIGEERVNAALRQYLRDMRFQQPPYTTSVEFLDYLRAVTPPSQAGLLEDLFETITLFQNKAVTAKAAELENGAYEVTLTVDARKVRADEAGAESDMPLDDWIDIGILGEDGQELYLQKAHITESQQEFTLLVDAKPAKAGIDIYNKLIDRDSNDNVVKVTIAETVK